MANVIEIVIHATDAATAQIRGVQGAAASLNKSLEGLVARVASPAGIAAAFTAAGIAAVAMGDKLSNEIETLRNLSARTGVSINELRALRQVMVEAGQSSESLTSALTIANRNLATQADALAKVGITATTPIEALLQLSDMVTRAGNSSKTTAAAFALLGRGGGELIPILNNLRPALVDMRERLGDLSQETIDAAIRWDEMMDKMGTSIKAFLDGSGGAFLRWWDRVTRANSTLDPSTWANMFRGGQKLPNEAFPGFDIAPPGGPEAGPPDPFALVRRNFGDTSGTAAHRPIVATTQEQWRKLVQVWNDAEPAAKKVASVLETMDMGLQAIKIGVESLAFGFLDAFDAILFRGQSVANALRDAFMSTIRDIANQLARIGLGLGLDALGAALGGPVGGVIAGVGRRLAGVGSMGGGNTYVIQTLEPGTLVRAMQPGGSWNRANDVVRIGSRY